MGGLREVAAPFVVPGPAGVAIRDRLKGLTEQDEKVLRWSVALGRWPRGISRPAARTGWSMTAASGRQRKRDADRGVVVAVGGQITKATHDQWALARRGQLAHIQTLEAGVRTIAHRLSLPVGAKGTQAGAGRLPLPAGVVSPSPAACDLLQDRLAAGAGRP